MYDTCLLGIMKLFETTVHCNINLGRNRGKKNTHYFGQYMKMMANTMHKVHNAYSQHSFDLKNNLIAPLEDFQNDEDLQKCINLKVEYNTKKGIVSYKLSNDFIVNQICIHCIPYILYIVHKIRILEFVW